MNRYIEKVFVDDQYQYGGMLKADLPAAKKNYYENAVKVLEETGADHVVYCHIEYSEDGEAISATFYSRLPMDDNTFYERTNTIPGTDYIGAVHKRQEAKKVDKREEIVKKIISAALHCKYENSRAYSKDEVLKEAVDLKNALESLYPVTDKQWQNILSDIGSYADCLI